MPGGKGFVNSGNKVHVQKRLPLSHLKELSVKIPDCKMGFSKLCELRPKCRVTVSSSGTHSVCVCTHHQNIKLIVDCFCSTVKTQLKRKAEESENKSVEVPKFDIRYKDLMGMVICDTTNLECMLHRCKNCPGYPALEKFIRNKFIELEIDGEMPYSQWESVDRTIRTQLMWTISSSC